MDTIVAFLLFCYRIMIEQATGDEEKNRLTDRFRKVFEFLDEKDRLAAYFRLACEFLNEEESCAVNEVVGEQCRYMRITDEQKVTDFRFEVMAKIGRAFDLTRRQELRGFAKRLAKNAIIDQFRKERHDPLKAVGCGGLSEEVADPDGSPLDKIVRNEVAESQARDLLKMRQIACELRDVLQKSCPEHLSWWDAEAGGKEIKDIAGEAGKKYMVVYRALRGITEELCARLDRGGYPQVRQLAEKKEGRRLLATLMRGTSGEGASGEGT